MDKDIPYMDIYGCGNVLYMWAGMKFLPNNYEGN